MCVIYTVEGSMAQWQGAHPLCGRPRFKTQVPHTQEVATFEFCQMEWDEGVTTAGVYRDLLMNWFAQCWVPVCHAGDPGTSPRSPA